MMVAKPVDTFLRCRINARAADETGIKHTGGTPAPAVALSPTSHLFDHNTTNKQPAIPTSFHSSIIFPQTHGPVSNKVCILGPFKI